MPEINQEEVQQELFLEFADAAKKPERFIPQGKVNKPILLSTSVEQVLLVGIASILVCCFVFFLGVLRGQSLRQKPPAVTLQKKAVPAAALPNLQIQPAAVPSRTLETQDPRKPYTIQLSTYRKRDLAEKEMMMLRRSGYYSVIIPNGGYFQVCVGQYAAKENAQKDLKAFGAKYKGCFLTRNQN